jgi:hypothetical protein
VFVFFFQPVSPPPRSSIISFFFSHPQTTRGYRIWIPSGNKEWTSLLPKMESI